MKKLAHILFILAYLLPTIGLTVAYHFCGEILVSTRVVLAEKLEEPIDCCLEEPQDYSCCDDQIISYKLDDLHFASAKICLEYIANDYTLIPTETAYQSSYTESFVFLSSISHSPPGNPTYIINRTLLI